MSRFIAAISLLACLAAAPATPQVDPIARDAADAARRGNLPAFAAQIDSRASEMLKDAENAELDELLRVCTYRQYARYFARVTQLNEAAGETLQWLAKQPRLAQVLMMSVSEADPPDRVLEVLRGLRGAHHKQLDEFAELAAAMCVVWDAPERFGPEEDVKVFVGEVERVFGHFVRDPKRLKFDPRKLPSELLVYVVDIELIDQELAWAAERYGNRATAAAFLDVRYDDYVGYDPRAKDISDDAYLLPNILRRGGNGEHAGHFAVQVARANGAPAATFRALGVTAGPPVAWAATLEKSGKQFGWDFGSGRFREHAGWPGETQDPQTYQTISDAELSILAALANTPPDDRLKSVALVKSADRAPADQMIALYTRALTLSPGNRAGWNALADLVAAGKLDDVQLKAVSELIKRLLVRNFPQFALHVHLRMIKGRGMIEHAAGISQMLETFRDRPDLIAMIRLAQGDRQKEDKKRAAALETFLEVLRKNSDNGPIVVMALSRVEPMLEETHGERRLAEVEQQLMSSLPRPKQCRHARTTPYFMVGWKYAQLLEELNQVQLAGQIRQKLDSLVLH